MYQITKKPVFKYGFALACKLKMQSNWREKKNIIEQKQVAAEQRKTSIESLFL